MSVPEEVYIGHLNWDEDHTYYVKGKETQKRYLRTKDAAEAMAFVQCWFSVREAIEHAVPSRA